MKIGFLFISLAFIFKPGLIFKAGKKPQSQQTFDKSGYYRVMASGDLAAIDSELVVLNHTMPREREGYEGALQMRKAGLLRRPKEKLAIFRSGATKLETAMAKDTGNGEYHFLRLIIQEHAPAVVHYHNDEEKDSQFIYRAFKTLPPTVQKAILDYCPHSKLLHAKELDG
ncbi:MAG TPA: hypothetical protein VGS79_11125 [Puia sp.]|nr:hypothetical protein [Puia sp.]